MVDDGVSQHGFGRVFQWTRTRPQLLFAGEARTRAVEGYWRGLINSGSSAISTLDMRPKVRVHN
jgi:hypothetical protein